MKLTDEVKAKIDAMSYEQLLRMWRHTYAGNPMFEGESGEYFAKRMQEQKPEDVAEVVRISKQVGW